MQTDSSAPPVSSAGQDNKSAHRKAGRARLLSMGTTYAMGTFNDNFFKQAALLLAASAGLHAIQGWATILFALPFAACSAWAGWLADRYPKRTIVVCSKFLELAAMFIGVWAMCTLSWEGMVVVVFLMALQSTFFSPALNGAIPENFTIAEVPRINALLKMATTVTILLGIALGGIVLDLPAPDFVESFSPDGTDGFGRLGVGIVGVLVSIVGVLSAFGISKGVPRDARRLGKNPFPWLGPIDSVRHGLDCRKKDPPLYLVFAGEAFFYTISTFALLCINNLGVQQLGFSKTLTSLLSVGLMVGICIGSLVAGRYEATSWRRLMLPSGVGMVSGLLLSSFSPLLPGWLQLLFLLTVFIATGFCGGLYFIPLISFIQVRPKTSEKGKVLAISNFASFTGIAISGLVILAAGNIPPSWLLAGSGVVGLIFMTWIAFRLGRIPEATLADRGTSPFGIILQGLLSLRYRVRVSGLDTIPAPDAEHGPILFMPNHPALIDPVIVFSRLAGLKPRALSDERQMTGLLGRFAARVLRAILIPDAMKDGAAALQSIRQGLQQVKEALEQGDSMLLYPSGRVYRQPRERLGGNSAAAGLIGAMPQLRVVLVRSTGLWGSSFSYAATGKVPNFTSALLRGLGILSANLLFFTPRREVHLEFIEPEDLPRDGNKRILNPWLEAYYNKEEEQPLIVPLYFWQGKEARLLASGPTAVAANAAALGKSPEDEALRQSVYAAIRHAANLESDHPLNESTALGADLGLDSLHAMELGLALEAEHGHPVSNLEALVTVDDCLAAARGRLAAATEAAPIPTSWFTPPTEQALRFPKEATTIPAAFLAKLRQAPNRALVADRSALRSRRQILTGALILAKRFKELPGQRIGIMLPSVPAVVMVWLATMLAGKEAVFFNWTVGEANLRHCINLAGVQQIISANALLERLQRQSLPIADLPVNWLRLEPLLASLSLWEKLSGLLHAHLPRRLIKQYQGQADEVAAVLFTSGSEALPKAVPLSHANLLTNACDIIGALRLQADEAILAMLPPFHSFGLMAGLVLPLSLGLRAVYHPNPTETETLVGLTRDFKLTLLATPPTFLAAILERAQGSEALSGLHYAFVGAEKCPDKVYHDFAVQCPQASLCEGYGITECSPVVSVNTPGAIVPGTIGHLMPSLTAVIVREEEGQIVGEVELGQSGMLLVRGSSIFKGYLGDVPDPFVDYQGHRWYRTGDLVSKDAGGRLTFKGRLKRFVKIGGEMISLPQIENILLAAFADHPEAPEEGPILAVEAGLEESMPSIVVFSTVLLSLTEINLALRAAGLSALYSVKRVVRVASIPILGSGKIDYRSLQAGLQKKQGEI